MKYPSIDGRDLRLLDIKFESLPTITFYASVYCKLLCWTPQRLKSYFRRPLPWVRTNFTTMITKWPLPEACEREMYGMTRRTRSISGFLEEKSLETAVKSQYSRDLGDEIVCHTSLKNCKPEVRSVDCLCPTRKVPDVSPPGYRLWKSLGAEGRRWLSPKFSGFQSCEGL